MHFLFVNNTVVTLNTVLIYGQLNNQLFSSIGWKSTAASIPVFSSVFYVALFFVHSVELREDAGRPDREGHD